MSLYGHHWLETALKYVFDFLKHSWFLTALLKYESTWLDYIYSILIRSYLLAIFIKKFNDKLNKLQCSLQLYLSAVIAQRLRLVVHVCSMVLSSFLAQSEYVTFPDGTAIKDKNIAPYYMDITTPKELRKGIKSLACGDILLYTEAYRELEAYAPRRDCTFLVIYNIMIFSCIAMSM